MQYSNQINFCSLASGSSGNCYYIGNTSHGILVDAGIGVKSIKKRLKDIGVPLESILGVFVTHDHYDHIASVGVLGEIHHIPIFSTTEILDGINRCYKVTQKIFQSKRPIVKNEQIALGDFLIEAFSVSHDASDCVGYSISYGSKKFTIATDLGYISSEAAHHLITAHAFVVESNYDEHTLLNNAAYPMFLKERILSKKGHLSNHELAEFLAVNYQEHWQHIFLCHLSKENNTPECAVSTIEQKIAHKRFNLWNNCALIALPRTTPTEVFSI
jgi:phosphoribosyl 1,2-cyclic phosphodiesterase